MIRLHVYNGEAATSILVREETRSPLRRAWMASSSWWTWTSHAVEVGLVAHDSFQVVFGGEQARC